MTTLVCETCGRLFEGAQGLGNHRRQLFYSRVRCPGLGAACPFACSRCDWRGAAPEFLISHFEFAHGVITAADEPAADSIRALLELDHDEDAMVDSALADAAADHATRVRSRDEAASHRLAAQNRTAVKGAYTRCKFVPKEGWGPNGMPQNPLMRGFFMSLGIRDLAAQARYFAANRTAVRSLLSKRRSQDMSKIRKLHKSSFQTLLVGDVTRRNVPAWSRFLQLMHAVTPPVQRPSSIEEGSVSSVAIVLPTMLALERKESLFGLSSGAGAQITDYYLTAFNGFCAEEAAERKIPALRLASENATAALAAQQGPRAYVDDSDDDDAAAGAPGPVRFPMHDGNTGNAGALPPNIIAPAAARAVSQGSENDDEEEADDDDDDDDDDDEEAEEAPPPATKRRRRADSADGSVKQKKKRKKKKKRGSK
ncbi:hypothetical protein M885DRAFT_577106 [Pelagophyceae sp. CCMP2097]|nr:hypothetical protein M885DRAFT_577106 [Pelagophyceae sp. CCMP2097]